MSGKQSYHSFHDGNVEMSLLQIRSILSIGVFLPFLVTGQATDPSVPRNVIEALFSQEALPALCVDDSAITISNRLGIQYDGVSRKSLISYEFEDSVKHLLELRQLEYTYTNTSYAGEYQLLTIRIPALTATREYYVRNGRLTSPFFALTHGWRTTTSTYFRFVFADASLTNRYAINMLDQFVLRVGTLLGYTAEEFKLLEEQKILYYLCRNDTEIHRLTGFRTRGMYNLAYDAIVSTYNAHFHELVHLLVNFKLRRLPLYTHPFLQEGLATGLGGRGGLDADVVVQLGAYLEESQMIQYSHLLRRSDFSSEDASVSYPLAGLYNRFLLHRFGVGNYIELYLKHSGRPADSNLEEILHTELPASADWQAFKKETSSQRTIQMIDELPTGAILWNSENATIADLGDRYHFAISGKVLFGVRDTGLGWHSTKFTELFPGQTYTGHRYATAADSQSISVYDLYTNTLISSYVVSFDTQKSSIPYRTGRYLFTVSKSLFQDETPNASFRDVDVHTK